MLVALVLSLPLKTDGGNERSLEVDSVEFQSAGRDEYLRTILTLRMCTRQSVNGRR